MRMPIIGLFPKRLLCGRKRMFCLLFENLNFQAQIRRSENFRDCERELERDVKKTKLTRSSSLTSFNLVISVLATFILLVKAVMFVLHIWYPLLATVTNAAITALWIVSIYGQAGPDHSDPAFPSNTAWYITHSCSIAKPTGNEHYCLMAKGTFAVTVFMAFIFFLNFALGIWSMIPSAGERAASKMEIDEMQLDDSPVSPRSGKAWEMTTPPKQPAVPYTPRTLAFNTLDRQLPLRSADPKYAPPPPPPKKGRWS